MTINHDDGDQGIGQPTDHNMYHQSQDIKGTDEFARWVNQQGKNFSSEPESVIRQRKLDAMVAETKETMERLDEIYRQNMGHYPQLDGE